MLKINDRCNLANLNSCDLMIVLAANKLIMRLKFKEELLVNFDLNIKVSTSWSKLSNIIEQILQPLEKVEFWSYDR